MIFEADFKSMEKPFQLMKSFLTDADYKTEKHAVTLEVSDIVTLTFYDPKTKLEMVYTMDDAEVMLEGIATCSMKALYDCLKSFKKSEDVILFEREGDIMRVDDGVYPEEMLVLFNDEELVVVETVDDIVPLFNMNGTFLSDVMSRSQVILKKTDIPVDKFDTQSVYLVGTAPDNFFSHSFSIHQSYTEQTSATIHTDFTLEIPKQIASLLTRVSAVLDDIQISQGFSDGQQVLYIKALDRNVYFFIKGNFILNSNLGKAFRQVANTTNEFFDNEEGTLLVELKLPGKVSAKTNLVVENGVFVEAENGYAGKVIKDFIQKGAITKGSLSFERKEDGILLLTTTDDYSVKTMAMSYRKLQSA